MLWGRPGSPHQTWVPECAAPKLRGLGCEMETHPPSRDWGGEGGSTAHAMAAASQQMAGEQMLGNAWPCGSSDQPMDRHLSWRGGEQRRPGAHDHHGLRCTPWPWEDRPCRSCLSQANRADACGSADDRTSRGSGRHRQVTRKTRRPKAMPMPAEVSSMRKAGSHRSRTRQRRAQAGLRAGSGGRIPLPHSAVL